MKPKMYFVVYSNSGYFITDDPTFLNDVIVYTGSWQSCSEYICSEFVPMREYNPHPPKGQTEMKQITKDSSKSDEIECIESVAKAIPEGTYLKDLFSREFISWVSEQIRNDFPPTLWEHYRTNIILTQNTRNQSTTGNQVLQRIKDILEKHADERI